MIQNLLWKIFGKKYLLGGVVAIYKAINGKKTVLCTIGIGIVYTGKILGYIPPDIADQLLALLSGAGGISFLHKLQKISEDYGIAQKAAELRTEALDILKKDGMIPSDESTTPPEATRG